MVVINLFTLSFCNVLNNSGFAEAVVAIEDKTFNAKSGLELFPLLAAIPLNIASIITASDFIITFANIPESPALLPAFATALIINLLTCVCALVSKDLLFSKLLSATDDNTCKERLELPSPIIPILDF